MGIKQKLSALISGGAGVGLLSAGGVEEAKAESYYNKYNTMYNAIGIGFTLFGKMILTVF
ncbi:MAG: hypothetical protein ACP5MV_02205 [Candidatus Parvarchaeum sp.]